MKKLSKRQFAWFKKRVAHWAEAFGMREWVITVTPDCQENDLAAWVTSDVEAREADMRLNTAWPEGAPKPTDRELDLTAAHECLHVLLSPLSSLIGKKASRREVDTAEHLVVQVLLKLVAGNPTVE